MKFYIVIFSIFLLGNTNGQAIVQDFTHGVIVDKVDFSNNPSKFKGKVIEVKNIAYTPSQTTNVKTKSSPLKKSPVAETVNKAITSNSATGGGSSSAPNSSPNTNPQASGDCPAAPGFVSQLVPITATFGPCMLMAPSVKKQFPTTASNLNLFIYCKPDGNFEIKRVVKNN